MILLSRERNGLVFRRGKHGGSVGFEEKAVGGNVLEGLTSAGFAFVKEVAIEGEVGSEFGEGGDHFGAAGVGVKKKGWKGGLCLEKC